MIKGSALDALSNIDDADKTKCIYELMEAVDNYIPLPPREKDKPFLMPVEDVFSITGRGTVGTGRIERGVCKVGMDVEIIGLGQHKKTVVTGIEMFRKLLDEGQAGDNVGLLMRGVEKKDLERGMVVVRPEFDQAAPQVRSAGVRAVEGRRRPAYAVLPELPSAVLLPHDRRDRLDHACRKASRWSCRATTL